MSPSDKINEAILKGWRELGFYYDYNDDQKFWVLVGSKQGLLNFSKILDEYVLRPGTEMISEDEHYGPYSYLKIMTWDKPVINNDAISGTLSDLKKLSNLIKKKLESQRIPSEFEIDKEYSNQNESKLRFEIKEDGFDPASADPQLKDYLELERS